MSQGLVRRHAQPAQPAIDPGCDRGIRRRLFRSTAQPPGADLRLPRIHDISPDIMNINPWSGSATAVSESRDLWPMMTERLKRTRGSGNVFLDVGFSPDEAENLLLRAQLMSRIRDVARGTTQREAAKQFGVTQPRLNDVIRGKIGKFSLDALVNMLAHAGMRVEMKVKKAA